MMAFGMNKFMMCCFIAVGTIAPASAAGPVLHNIVCSTNEPTGAAREFKVRFVQSKSKLKLVTVTEKQRVFTPGNAVAIWSTANGGTMLSIPDQRPGKWTGKTTPAGYDFALKAADGAAAFSFMPATDGGGQYRMNWNAILYSRFGDEQRANGTGSCYEQGSAG